MVKMNNRGLTLLELLISAAISVIIVGSALSVYLAQHKHMIIQDQISDMQQNVRAGMQELATKIRMAGYNVPDGVQAIRASNTNPDSIEITFDTEVIDGVELNQAMASPSAELICDGDLTPLQVGDWLFIYDATLQTGEFFTVSGLDIGSGRISHSSMPFVRSYPLGSPVKKLVREKYYIDRADTLHPRLMISSMGQTPQIYSDNITNLQFRYVLSSGAVVDVPPLATMIREVIIDLTARADRADNDSFNRYRTRDLQTRVKVRNLGIN
jgi:Tfp pilus assembly protein PilW